MAGLGDLVVRLSAETAQFTQALDKATYQTQKNFQTMQTSAKNLAGALGLYLSADAFSGFIKSQINAMDALNDMSERTGVAVEELSKLSYAAKLSDVTIEQLQGGLTKLNKGIAETANGTGEAQKAFSAMGISVKNADGSLKNSSQVLNDVADRFVTYQDGANKSALAIQLFGKSGAELIPLLNQGSDGLKKMGDELQRFGGVVTADAAKNAGLFNDNMDKLGIVVSAVGKSLANSILPYLIRFSEELLVARANGLGLIQTLALFGSLNGRVEERLQGVNEQLDKLNDPKRVVLGDRKKQIDELTREKNALEQLLKISKDSKTSQDDLNKSKKASADAPAVSKLDAEALKSAIRANQDYVISLNDIIEKRKESFETPFMDEVDKSFKGDTDAILKGFQTQQKAIQKSLEDGKISAKQYNEQVANLVKSYQDAYIEAEVLANKQRDLNSTWEYGASVALAKYGQESKNTAKLTEDVVTKSLNSLDDSLFGIITRTTSVADAFKSMTASILSDIAKILIRQSITAPIANALAGAIGGAFTSNINLGSQSLGATSTGSTGFGINPNASYSGVRASGGLVQAGSSYLVGERGMEVFTPTTGGNITSTDKLGSTNVIVNVNMAEGTTSASDGNQLGIMIGNVVKAELVKQKRAGGLLA